MSQTPADTTPPDEEWGSVEREPTVQDDSPSSVLGRVRIFQTLSSDDLRQLERIVHRRTYNPQEPIVRQGNPGLGMYIIQSGSARVILESPDGESIPLATLSDAMCFGEMSLLDGAHRAASVIAVERCRVMGFFRSDLMDLIERSPKLGFKIVFSISQRIHQRLTETLDEFRDVQRAIRAIAPAAGDA